MAPKNRSQKYESHWEHQRFCVRFKLYLLEKVMSWEIDDIDKV